jgi:uncharacterized protein (DUF1697 family)
MSVHVALLRGINVGANKRMKMEALRKVFAELGLEGAQTYLQSGNVVFQSKETDKAKLAKRIETAIEEAFGFHSDIILRSAAEVRQVIASDPFADRLDLDPAKLLVLFLGRPLTAAEVKALRQLNVPPDEVLPDETEIYIYYPNGMGRSKLDVAMAKVLKTNGTGRNWRSTLNILSMMERLEER